MFVEGGIEVLVSTAQKKITPSCCSVGHRFQEHVHGSNEYRLQPYQQWALLLKELGQMSLLHTQLGHTAGLGEVLPGEIAEVSERGARRSQLD